MKNYAHTLCTVALALSFGLCALPAISLAADGYTGSGFGEPNVNQLFCLGPQHEGYDTFQTLDTTETLFVTDNDRWRINTVITADGAPSGVVQYYNDSGTTNDQIVIGTWHQNPPFGSTAGVFTLTSGCPDPTPPPSPGGGFADLIATSDGIIGSTTGLSATAITAWTGPNLIQPFIGSIVAILYYLRYWIVAGLIIAAIVYFSRRAFVFFKH